MQERRKRVMYPISLMREIRGKNNNDVSISDTIKLFQNKSYQKGNVMSNYTKSTSI